VSSGKPTIKQQRAAERERKLAEFRKQEARRKRNRTIAIGSAIVGGVVVVALLVVSFVLIPQPASYSAGGSGADVEGVETFENTSAHVTGAVDYAQTPPAGGEHNPAWLNCGVYTESVPNENAVHSLEHGAVWITYDPALPAADVATLQAFAENQSYVLVSPYEGLDSPVTVSAWGYQLKVDSVDDERLPVFIQKYLLNPELAEVGAPCSSGVGTPA
jgi:hypothetical protein